MILFRIATRAISICFFVAIAHLAAAQSHHFIQYGLDQGLAQSQVMDILQTSDGHIWVATVGGVSRFNGFSFENYNKSDGLLSNEVHSLYESKDGKLWMGCEGGITTYEKGDLQSVPFENPYGEVSIYQILEVPQQEGIFLSTNGHGILVYDSVGIHQLDIGEGEVGFVRCMEWFEGALWVGTKQGLFKQVGNMFLKQDLFGDISISSMDKFRDQLWIGTYGNGAWKLQGNHVTNFTVADGLINNHIRDCRIDMNGNVWFISKHGLGYYGNGKFRAITPLDATLNRNFRCVYVDVQNNIWVGTEGNGLLKFAGKDLSVYTTRDGLPSDFAMSFNEDHNGHIWFATYGGGVARYDGEIFKVFDYKDGLVNNTVWSTITDREGRVWFGTSDGASIFDGEIFVPVTEGLPYPRISYLFEDREGNIYACTREGVATYGNGKFIPLKVGAKYNPLLKGIRDVKSCTQDKGGNIWFATSNGTFVYGPQAGTLKRYTKNDGLSEEPLTCFEWDKGGNLWIGSENGLTHYDGTRFLPVEVSDNFSSNIVNFLLADANNKLWIGTDNGIFRLHLDAFYGNGEVKIEPITEHDGAISRECNQNAAFMDSQQRVWLGTNGGVLLKNPEDMVNQGDKGILNLEINSVQLNFEKTDWTKTGNSDSIINGIPLGLELRYNQNRITFHYTGLEFVNPTMIRYSYRLLGSDEDWSPATTEQHVTYSNIRPGIYTFQVRAKLLNGEWHSDMAEFDFQIHPPFYLSWWFLSLCLIAAGFIVYAVHLMRKKNRERERDIENLKNKAKILGLEQQTLNAHMNRHFIFNALNSIQYYINTSDRRSANSYLSSFAQLVRKNLDSSQQEMIYLQEELDRLNLYLRLEQMRFKDRFEFEISIDPTLEKDEIRVPSMILQPFAENSIMHGILPNESPGKISISIKRLGENIEFCIKDNGIGIDRSRDLKKEITNGHVSNGMKITRQRMELLQKMYYRNFSVQGPYQITENGQIFGTEVKIVIPAEYEKIISLTNTVH